MKTLHIAISDNDYSKFKIEDDEIPFGDFVDLIRRQVALENLEACVALSEKYGLSTLTDDEINAEIKATRIDDKNHR